MTHSAGNTSNSSRPRKEKKLTYVLNDADDVKHCAGINCLAVLKPPEPGSCDYLFTGSRDGTLKRWELTEDTATCSSTFESHADWVNDAVIAGNDTLVSCSSDTTLKIWNCMSDGICTKTLHQHSDYVTCLAVAKTNGNMLASGGLGAEVFLWDLEAAVAPVSKSTEAMEDDSCNGGISSGTSGPPIASIHSISSSSSISPQRSQSRGYSPIVAKGHKESVYALAMNDSGTVLVSGGTEKVVRVWDSRTGVKAMKLRGHTDNIRALIFDSTGRFCLSGSSDSMIRLWDLGQQRCVHSYAVHTDSVWALASTPTFSHVYSGGRDQSLYLTDLATRESLLLCTNEHPILQLALHDSNIWVATTASSINRWPAEGYSPQKLLQRGGSFLAGNLSFTRARASLEGSSPVPVYKEPSLTIPGAPAIVQHEVLNNRRQVLTKDTNGFVKLWEITRGIVVDDFGRVSFEEKKEELFEMISIPAWFTTDTRLGSLAIHLEIPQCFSAEMYSADLSTVARADDDKVNLAVETLKGLFVQWVAKRRKKSGPQTSENVDLRPGTRNPSYARIDIGSTAENNSPMVHPSFEFSTLSPPSIIMEGSHGGPWRKKITDLDGTEDEKSIPWWCMECVLHRKVPVKDYNNKCSFYLHVSEDSTVKVPTQGKLSAPRILRIQKVINYVLEKLILDKPLDGGDSDGTFVGGQSPLSTIRGDGIFVAGVRPRQKLKPSVEIMCNNQVLSPEMSLATVRAYIWKKPDDLLLNYRVVQGR